MGDGPGTECANLRLHRLGEGHSGGQVAEQIFIGEFHVGGFDDMAELDAFGKLDPLLGLAPHLDETGQHLPDASEDGPT